jgi:hypothetical protein
MLAAFGNPDQLRAHVSAISAAHHNIQRHFRMGRGQHPSTRLALSLSLPTGCAVCRRQSGGFSRRDKRHHTANPTHFIYFVKCPVAPMTEDDQIVIVLVAPHLREDRKWSQ